MSRSSPGNLEGWRAEVLGAVRAGNVRVVLITGRERVGKSNLAILLARLLDSGWRDGGVSQLDRIVFRAADLVAYGKRAGRGEVVVLDEAVEGGFSREALSEQNRRLFRWLVVSGARGLITVIVYPNKSWLDPYVKDHRAMDWFHVGSRGFATHHVPRRGIYQEGVRTFWDRSFQLRFPAVKDVPGCGALWAAYERKKMEYILGQRATGKKPKHDATTLLNDVVGDMLESAPDPAGWRERWEAWHPWVRKGERGPPAVGIKGSLEPWRKSRRLHGLPSARAIVFS